MKNVTRFGTLFIALFAILGLVACDDSSGYDLVPCTTCGNAGTGGTGGSAGSDGTGNLNPGEGGAGGDESPQPNPSNCKAVPSFWDLRSYNGCMTQADLTVALREANHHEQWLDGKAFNEDNTNKIGELVYLTADGSECGPVTVAAVSNSGSIQLVAGADVDWYLVDPPMVELIWTKLHNGNAPSYADIQSGPFASLVIDIFECEVTNTSCSLKSSIPGGWPTYGGIVEHQLYGPNATADGSFCGHMYVVARSR